MGVSDWLQAFNTVIALLALAFVARATTILANQTKTFVEQAQSMRRQNEIANRVALVSAFDELTTKAMALDQFFFENPDMKRYVYGDEPLPAAGTVQSEQVESVCEMLCDLMELADVHRTELGAESFSTWDSYFADLASRSAALRSFLLENRAWYRPGVAEAAGLPPVRDEGHGA